MLVFQNLKVEEMWPKQEQNMEEELYIESTSPKTYGIVH